jgi:pyruvate dehydrogenase E2 component (dihydrolipoamide acetyltransferase)
MPKLGNTVEECLLARWVRSKGEQVAAGELIAEIETDKATFEVVAPVAGTVLETFLSEGELAPVFTNICVIGEPGEDVEPFRPQVVGRTPGSARDLLDAPSRTAESVASSQKGADEGVGRGPGGPPHNRLSPRARRFAAERDFHPAEVPGSGPGGRVLESDLKQAYFESPRISSLALRSGSGPHGMILARDLAPPPARISGVRERIARRMRESLAASAQYTLNSSAAATGLLRLKTRASINDLVLFCAVKALLEMPEMNAELVDGKLYRHPHIHLAFACDTPKGLLAPVIRNSEALSLDDLSRQAKALAEQAIDGSISPDDLTGATFTVSNLGSLGIESFTPILNPPQVALLGVDTIQLKPVRREGKVEFVEHIGLSLTCDHQVIDGAPGARFLAVVRRCIENVEALCGT